MTALLEATKGIAAGRSAGDQLVLDAIPPDALSILEVGCGDGVFGAAIRRMNRARKVYGTERDHGLAAEAETRLDGVYRLDPNVEDLPLERGSLDCIVYRGALESVENPLEVLLRHRTFLKKGGRILCLARNMQHHVSLIPLLRGNLPCPSTDTSGSPRLRAYTLSALIRLLLDAGFAPRMVKPAQIPCPDEFFQAFKPIVRYLGLHEGRARMALDASEYLIEGIRLQASAANQLGGVGTAPESKPLTFVACVSNEQVLCANLLSSPCLRPGSPHELIAVRDCHSAAEGLSQGIERASHDIVVCLHQDMYLPEGWPERFRAQWDLAEKQFGALGVAGVYGVKREAGRAVRLGHVVDQLRYYREGDSFPARVDTLDEIVLAVRRNTPLRFDPSLGFHLYGADIALQAKGRGLPAVVLNSLCFHNQATVGVPPAYRDSACALAAKWPAELPIPTPCAEIDRRAAGVAARLGVKRRALARALRALCGRGVRFGRRTARRALSPLLGR
jgi:ubiquinone/menaquinone biosynthesis C-methylase UbiE